MRVSIILISILSFSFSYSQRISRTDSIKKPRDKEFMCNVKCVITNYSYDQEWVMYFSQMTPSNDHCEKYADTAQNDYLFTSIYDYCEAGGTEVKVQCTWEGNGESGENSPLVFPMPGYDIDLNHCI